MNYIVITEVTPIPVHKEPDLLLDDDIRLYLENIKFFNVIDLNKQEKIPCYIFQKISQETFDFIKNVANIEMKKFGEKVYKINNVEFEIITEEDYKNRYGEYDN